MLNNYLTEEEVASTLLNFNISDILLDKTDEYLNDDFFGPNIIKDLDFIHGCIDALIFGREGCTDILELASDVLIETE